VIKVLIMEDDADQAITLSAALKDGGCKVEIAYSGSEAWMLLQRERYDVLVTDMQVASAPGSDRSEGGLALIIRIRGDKTGPDWLDTIKIIAISGYQDYGQERLDRANIFGADRSLLKPVTGLQVMKAINEVR